MISSSEWSLRIPLGVLRNNTKNPPCALLWRGWVARLWVKLFCSTLECRKYSARVVLGICSGRHTLVGATVREVCLPKHRSGVHVAAERRYEDQRTIVVNVGQIDLAVRVKRYTERIPHGVIA